MAKRTPPPKPVAAAPTEPAFYLDMPAERRAAAKGHVAVISATVRQVAKTLPLSADVDDFRRVLVANAPAGAVSAPKKPR